MPLDRPRYSTLNKMMLWFVAALTTAFLIAPGYVAALVGENEGGTCCAAPQAVEGGNAQTLPTDQVVDDTPRHKVESTESELTADPSNRAAATLTTLSDDAQELKTAFNEDKGVVRVMLIVSPRCPACRAGASLVQKEALAQIDSDKLKVYVVWIKRLFFDSKDGAQKATELVPDKRARHFWDFGDELGKRYGKTLNLPGNRDFAWDVYFVFDKKAEWADDPPTPDFWMHQLGGPETGNMLDGGRFRDAIRQQLSR